MMNLRILLYTHSWNEYSKVLILLGCDSGFSETPNAVIYSSRLLVKPYHIKIIIFNLINI